MKELIAAAKKAPGTIDYASAGVGSPFHLAAELFAQSAGIKLNHVPYKGAGPALQDLAGGQIGMMFVDFASARSQLDLEIDQGDRRLLAGRILRPARRAARRNRCSRFRRLGVAGFRGAREGRARRDRETARRLCESGQRSRHPAEADRRRHRSAAKHAAGMADYIAAETAKWAKVIKTAGIKLD